MNALTPITRTARIIVTDPFERRQDVHDVPAGGMLADALMDLSPDRWGGAHIELYDGAITAAGALPLDEARAIRLLPGRIYHVVKVPAEPISTGAIIAAAIGVTSTVGVALVTVAVYIAIMAVTMAISYLATMLLAPGKQTQKALASEDQPSALNSLSPPRNSFRIGSRVPEIYGTIRFWPDLIFPASSVWSPILWDHDLYSWSENTKATSEQRVRAVYCLGRGHFQMADFQFGDSAVANANGAVYIYPPGVPLPSSVTAMYAVADLSRQELGGPGSANMWSPWYTIPSDEVMRIDVQIAFPQGLMLAVSGKKVPPGYVERTEADIRIQMERLDENDNVVESIERQRVYQSKTRNELRVTSQESVPTGRWRVRVAQVYQGVPYPNGNIYTFINKTALEGIVGHRFLTEAERTYEHETCIIVEASNVGSPALQNMEAFNLMASRVLPTQDVPGIMTEWRADARWITAAINTLTDPFICGYEMDEVDWPSLHAVQASLEAYPEGYAEGEFNAALDRQMTADEQLMLVARKARASVFPSGGRITFARDERRVGVSALFNRRNRLAGRAEVGLGLQFKQRDDPDGVIVSFINAAENYRQDTYTYPEGITPAAPLSMDLIGAVWPHEVCRRARFEYAAMKYRRRSMPLRVTEEGQLLLPTERVAVVMPWNEGTIDGEVLEIDGTDLRLDRPVPALTSSARIRLRREDGMATQLLGLINSPRGPEWVTIGALPSFEIIVPTEDRQLGTLYSLSKMDADDKATFWFVTGAQVDDGGVTLTLGEDSDEVFQLSDDLLDPCTDALPFRFSFSSTQGGDYNGGPAYVTAPPADPGDILVAVLGATTVPFTAPAGWTVIDEVVDASSALGQGRCMLVCYRVVQAGDSPDLVFPRAGGTLTGVWVTRIGVNRAKGAIVYGGKEPQQTVRAVEREFSLDEMNINSPNSVVLVGLVCGATIYTDPWPITACDVPGLWTQQSTISWTPGTYPVYATQLYSFEPPEQFTGPTGPLRFQIPTNSNPANNNLFTTSRFRFYYDPSAGGTLTPKSVTAASKRRARMAARVATADPMNVPDGGQMPIRGGA